MTEEEKDAIREAIDIIENSISRQSDRHWSTYIFEKRTPDDTPEKKYRDIYCEREVETIRQLEEIIA